MYDKDLTGEDLESLIDELEDTIGDMEYDLRKMQRDMYDLEFDIDAKKDKLEFYQTMLSEIEMDNSGLDDDDD